MIEFELAEKEKVNKKRPSAYLRLKEHHPTMVKLDKAFQLLEELGLNFSFDYGVTSFLDNDFPDTRMYLVDSDSGQPEGVDSFPPICEYYVRHENPERTAFDEQELIEHQAKMAEDKKKKAREAIVRNIDYAKMTAEQAQKKIDDVIHDAEKAKREYEKAKEALLKFEENLEGFDKK